MPRKPQKASMNQPVGRSQTDIDDAKEESHATCTAEGSGLLAIGSPAPPPPTASRAGLLADHLFDLFEDVRTLKASAIDSQRQAGEIEDLRSELKRMKSQVRQLTSRSQNLSNSGESLHEKAGTQCEKRSRTDSSRISRDKLSKADESQKGSRRSTKGSIMSSSQSGTALSPERSSTLPSPEKSNVTIQSAERLCEFVEHVLCDAAASHSIDASSGSRPTLVHGLRPPKHSSKSGFSVFGKTKYATGFEEVFTTATKTIEGFPKLDSRIHDLCAQDAIYDLSGTIWDILPFCGLEPLTIADQLCVITVALLNLAVQAGFIALVWTTMLENDFSNHGIVNELKDWRVLYAHNPDYADAFTDQTLAEEICGNSFLRMEGASQAALFNEIDDHTKSFLYMPCGALLSMLSIFLWILTCARECKKTLMYFIGIWTPNDTTKRFIWETSIDDSFVQVLDRPLVWYVGEERQKSYQIFLTQKRALVLSVLSFLPRTIILVLLSGIGCRFLAQTLQLSELILNAVALDVVLHVDELLFDILVPAAARRLVSKTLPLRVPRTKRGRIAHWIFMVVVALTWTVVGLYILGPMVKTMTDAKSVMCGGDQEFLAFQLPFGPIAATRIASNAVDRNMHEYRAIFQRTNLSKSTNMQDKLYLSGGVYTSKGPNQVLQVKQWRDRSISDVASLDLFNRQSPSCDKMLDNAMPLQRHALRTGIGSIVGNESLQSCDGIVHLCSDTSLAGSVTRLACARSCGAEAPLSGLYLETSKDGIPERCRWEYIRNLWFLDTCKDADIAHSVAAIRYAKGGNWSP